jgi:hypothetical protein
MTREIKKIYYSSYVTNENEFHDRLRERYPLRLEHMTLEIFSNIALYGKIRYEGVIRHAKVENVEQETFEKISPILYQIDLMPFGGYAEFVRQPSLPKHSIHFVLYVYTE